MSVIDKALKAAQKEKQKKTGNAGPPPVLVPLRSRETESTGFSWQRALLLGGGALVVFGVTALTVNMMKGRNRVGPVPAPIILGHATPAATDSASLPIDSIRVPVPEPATKVASRPAVSEERPTQSSTRRVPAPATTTRRPAAQAVAPAEKAGPATDAGLRISVEAQREDAARLFAAGVAAHREGNLSYARSAYERVLVLAPGDVDAMNNLALLLLASRELDAAERLLRRAVSLAPRNAGVWSNLGTVLRERGQSADAIAAFQHALSIDPAHQATRISLAQQFLAIGSLPKAREILDRVVAENPAIPEAQYALGQVLEQQGDISSAIRAYSTFVRVAPSRFATHVEFVRRRIDELSAKSR